MRRIYQTADWHIKTSSNPSINEERKTGINKFIKSVATSGYNGESDVVVVCGDIFNNFDEYSGEDIEEFFSYIHQLRTMLPVILIPGNHDVSKTKVVEPKPCLIRPLLENYIQTAYPVLYYNKSGKYNYKDIEFYLLSQTDCATYNPYNLATLARQSTCRHKILLAHEYLPIDSSMANSKVDTIFAKKSRIDIRDMSAFTMAMSGHIHESAFLSNTVAYCGSLIQITKAESCRKGYIMWNLQSMIGNFIRIPIDYGVIIVKLVNNNVTSMPHDEDLPLIAAKSIEIRHIGCSPAFVDTYIAKFRTLYPTVSPIISDGDSPERTQSFLSSDAINSTSDALIESEDRKDCVLPEDRIISYISRKTNSVTNNTLSAIRELHKDIVSSMPNSPDATALYNSSVHNRAQKWNIKKLEWANIGCYGEDNAIDFTAINSLTGIIARNQMGKSLVFDILLYGLFAECVRGSLSELLDKKRNPYVRVEFTCGEPPQNYVIIRRANANSYSDTTLLCENKLIDVALLPDLIGTYQYHITTSIMTQDNHSDFVSMRNAARRETFKQMCGITAFDELWEIAKTRKRDVMAKLSNYGDLPTVSVIDAKIAELSENLTKATDKSAAIRTRVIDLNAKLEQLCLQYNRVDYDEQEYLRLKQLVDAISANQMPSKPLAKYQTIMQNYQATLRKVSATNARKYAVLDETALMQEKDKLLADINRLKAITESSTVADQSPQKLTELATGISAKLVDVNRAIIPSKQTVIDMIQRQIEANQQELAKSLYKFDANCPSCTSNESILIAHIRQKVDIDIAHLEKLNLDEIANVAYNIKANALRAKLNDELLLINNILAIRPQIMELNEAITDIDSIIFNNKVNSKIALCRSKINQVTIIEQYNKQKSNIDAFNESKKIEKRIDTCRKHIAAKQVCQGEIEMDIAAYKHVLYGWQTKRESAVSHDKLVDEKQVLTKYIDAMSPKGISCEMSSRSISRLNTEINNILRQMSIEFAINITCDEKKLDIHIQREGNSIPIERGCGLQKFMTSILMRIAMCKLFPKQSGDFICIDEGFTSLDEENQSNLPVFFAELQTHFKLIFVISHMVTIQRMLREPLEILKVGAHSKLVSPNTTISGIADASANPINTVLPKRKIRATAVAGVVANDDYVKCPVANCNKSFKTARGLQVHLTRTHSK